MDAIWLVFISTTDQLIRLLPTHCECFIVAFSQIVEMIWEYLQVSHSTRGETEELERLASQLTLSAVFFSGPLGGETSPPKF